MKKCPQCGRDYNDDSLRFCLDDGSELLFGLGELEDALDRLEDAWRMRTILLMWIKTEPIVDALREEPRFKNVLLQMNLSD